MKYETKYKQWKLTAIFLIVVILVLGVTFVFTIKKQEQKSSYLDQKIFVSGRFLKISDHKGVMQHEIIFYDTETGVEYMYCDGPYVSGVTPLLNSDGTPILYYP